MGLPPSWKGSQGALHWALKREKDRSQHLHFLHSMGNLCENRMKIKMHREKKSAQGSSHCDAMGSRHFQSAGMQVQPPAQHSGLRNFKIFSQVALYNYVHLVIIL